MKYDNDNKAHLRYRSRLPAVEGGYIRYKPDVPVSIVDKKATNFPWLNEKEEEEKKIVSICSKYDFNRPINQHVI